jgi:hypothetical protein
MSGDPRSKYFLMALQNDDIELYPIYWKSFFKDPDEKTIYCWRMATSARKIDSSIIDEMLNQDKLISDSVDSGAKLIFALGAMDFFVHVLHTKNPAEVAEEYFDHVYNYCVPKGIPFMFVSPVYSNPVSELIDVFNSTLAQLCNLHGVGDIIVYPENIPYKKYDPVDKFNHASLEIMQSVASHIKNYLDNGAN